MPTPSFELRGFELGFLEFGYWGWGVGVSFGFWAVGGLWGPLGAFWGPFGGLLGAFGVFGAGKREFRCLGVGFVCRAVALGFSVEVPLGLSLRVFGASGVRRKV